MKKEGIKEREWENEERRDKRESGRIKKEGKK